MTNRANAMIPQNDPGAGYQELRQAINNAIDRVLTSGWYILGREVAAFEEEFANFLGDGQHAIGVANGTDALVLALHALAIGPGDGVVTVSHSAVATVAAVEMAGAVPVLADIDGGFTLDANSLDTAIRRAPVPVRAVIVVHLYGQPADLTAIQAVVATHGLRLIEDCAQAHGAAIAGQRIGTFGDAAAFSLYPTKNLGALGDGGLVTTGDPLLAARLRALREYGWRDRYISDMPGRNSRLDEIQAAILRAKLPRLDVENARRADIAQRYDAGSAGLAITTPWRRPGVTHVFHQYVIRHTNRDRLQRRLRELGVATAIHYPVPIHLQPAYRNRLPLPPGGLPATEEAARDVLSLPMYPQLSDGAVQQVIGALRQADD